MRPAPLLALLALAAAESALLVRGPDDATCDPVNAAAMGEACGQCFRVWTNPPGVTTSCL